jgi:hypothetical protein
VLYLDIFSIYIADLLQAFRKSVPKRIGIGRCRGNPSLQESDPWDFAWLLRLCEMGQGQKHYEYCDRKASDFRFWTSDFALSLLHQALPSRI